MEEKSYYELWPVLPYEKNEKYEYWLYTKHYENERQLVRFSLFFESVEEWFQGLSYLIGKGWNHCMKFKHSFGKREGTETCSWMEARKQKIKNRPKPVEPESYIQDTDFDGRLEIDIIISYKKLDDFRATLKEWPGFTTTWLYPDCKLGYNCDNKYLIP